MPVMFRTTGTLVLDPTSKTIPFRPWWGIVVCCADLGAYYLSRLSWEMRARQRVQKPSWGPHVSVVRGEEVEVALWEELKAEHLEVEVWYGHEVRTNDEGKHFWLEVEFPRGEEIRRRLGLPPAPVYPWHLTVAVRGGGQQ